MPMILSTGITPAQIDVLTIRHFKAFNGTLEFKLNRKNVVILGENGSGKTSLTRALSAVLDATRRSTDDERKKLFQRCVDADTSTPLGFIQLDLVVGELTAPKAALQRQSFTLHEDGTSSSAPGLPALPSVTLVEAAKAKRVLDYKGLLRTYLTTGETVDLFDLLIKEVLVEDLNPITNKSFGEEWQELERLHQMKRNQGTTRRDLQTLIDNLNNGLAAKLASLVTRAQPLLQAFDPTLSFDIRYGALVPAARTSPVPTGYAYLDVKRAGNVIVGHTEFLNEARLSAIALCLHFAVLLEAPRTSLNILVLDDVLIGLDMDNRKPTLKLLDDHFKDWQTMILTYDPEWFDIVRLWSVSKNWECFKLHRFGDAGQGTTLVDKSKGLLVEADRHLGNGDLSPAANAARSAFENVLKRHFEDNGLDMTFKLSLKALSSQDFWRRATKLTDAMGVLVIPPALARDVEAARAIVLNPLSHDPNRPLQRREVGDAIAAVRLLGTALGVTNP